MAQVERYSYLSYKSCVSSNKPVWGLGRDAISLEQPFMSPEAAIPRGLTVRRDVLNS